MSFWLDQDLQILEEKLNSLGEILKINHLKSLRERFGVLKEEKSDKLYFSDDQKCECTFGLENLTIIKPKSELLCVAPILALIIGSDKVDSLICTNFRKQFFKPYQIKKQKKMPDFFSPKRDEASATENVEEQLESQSFCNHGWLLNEFLDCACFIRFVRIFEVNIRIHKSGPLEGEFGCRNILGFCPDYPTVHLYYATGYQLVLPPIYVFTHMPTENLSSQTKLYKESLESELTSTPLHLQSLYSQSFPKEDFDKPPKKVFKFQKKKTPQTCANNSIVSKETNKTFVSLESASNTDVSQDDLFKVPEVPSFKQIDIRTFFGKK